MKQWLLAAGIAALAAGMALPVLADDAPKCTTATHGPMPDPKLAADDAAALAATEKGAAGGVVSDMIDLATVKEQGAYNTPIDRAGALDLYERAAGSDDTIGRRKMCIAYLLGEGRPKNAARGMDYCNALGDKDPVGLFARGYDYQMGLTGPADEGVAMGFYIDAVKAGSGDAAVAMAGIATKAGKLDLARQWFQRGVYLGSADAMDGLASMTEAGQGGLTDAVEAGWLYRNAASRGNVHATEQMSGRTVEMERMCLMIGGGKIITTAEGTRYVDNASKTAPVITHTYTDKSGPKSETLTYGKLIGLLSANFPQSAIDAGRGGMASIECYVDANHVFDACVVPREYPATLGFGRALEAQFNGHMSISETDDFGNSTAQHLLQQTVRWQMDSGKKTQAQKGYGTTVRYGPH